MTKYCNRCNKTYSISNFYTNDSKKGDGYSPYCRKCMRIQVIERYRYFKIQCLNYKGGKCQKCGYNKCISALEFHHRDSAKKDFSVSSIKKKIFNDLIKQELDKCDLLCSNCHRELHFNKSDIESAINKNPIKKSRIYKSPKINLCLDCKNNIPISSIRCKKCKINYVKKNKEKFIPAAKDIIYKWKDKKNKLSKNCKLCGAKTFNNKYCSYNCYQKDRRICDRPDFETLKKLLSKYSMVKIGKMFGVSDNAIRKWIYQYSRKK